MRVYSRGEAYECLGYYQLALDDYNAAIIINPGASVVRRHRAHICYLMNDYKSALSDYDELIRSSACGIDFALRSRVFYALHDYTHALMDAQRAINFYPKLATAYVSRAYANMGLGRFQDALSDCDWAKSFAPRSTEWTLCSAEVFLKEKKWLNVISLCTTVVGYCPNDARAYWFRAEAYNHLHNYKQAEADATIAICHNPAQAGPYSIRAQARHALNETDGALSDAERVSHLDPNLAKSTCLTVITNPAAIHSTSVIQINQGHVQTFSTRQQIR